MDKLKDLRARLAQSSKAKFAALVAAAMVAPSAMAQTEASSWDSFFDAIGLDGVAAKVIALGVIIVGIAMAFKGPDVSKRVIRKV